MHRSFNGSAEKVPDCENVASRSLASWLVCSGNEFSPYLPNATPALIESCEQAEHGEDGVQNNTGMLVPSIYPIPRSNILMQHPLPK